MRLYQRNKHLTELSESTGVQPFPLQRWLLDYYAISKGFRRWRIMLREAFENRNYQVFEEILQDERIYGVDGTGWRATMPLLMACNFRPMYLGIHDILPIHCSTLCVVVFSISTTK